jgi:ribosomal protein L11 methyltransferase
LLRTSRVVCDRGHVPTEWFECTIEIPAEHSEAVGNFLIENGAPGLQSDDCNSVVRLTTYFATEPPVDALLRFCTIIGCPLPTSSLGVRRIPHEDWAENWKLHFQPESVGRRLYVCPPWNCTPPPGRVAVIIDPGMAFGTGQHATTRGCLLLLEAAVAQRAVTRALDIGTGSGVLAIALAKLGVAEVWAIDTDTTACAIAADNARCNRVGTHVSIRSRVDEVAGLFDLITANLFANLLDELAVRFSLLLGPDGVLICSGFLTADESRVRSAYEAHGLQVVRRHEEQSWVTLALQGWPQP